MASNKVLYLPMKEKEREMKKKYVKTNNKRSKNSRRSVSHRKQTFKSN